MTDPQVDYEAALFIDTATDAPESWRAAMRRFNPVGVTCKTCGEAPTRKRSNSIVGGDGECLRCVVDRLTGR